MTLTVGTPTRAASVAGASFFTLSNFTVPSANQVLVVLCTHEVSSASTVITGVTFGGVSLTREAEARQTSGTSNNISLWALANPSVSTASIVVTANANADFVVVAFLVDGADLSSGLASAINATASFTSSGSGTIAQQAIAPSVANTLIIDGAILNDPALSLSANNSQTQIYGEQYSGFTGWTYTVGKVAGGASGSRTLGYSASTTYARGNYVAIAIAPASASVTLGELSFTQTTTDPVAGEDVSWTIAGKTTGSTVDVTFSDGSNASTSTATLTKSGGFAMPGVKVGTPIETLAGATNTPHMSASLNATILTQVKVGVAGSSTPANWTSNSFSTTEPPNSRLRVWNGSSYASFASVAGPNKGPGGVGFGNYLLSKLGPNYRVDLINGALGGTGLQNWANREGPANGNYPACRDLFLARGVDFVVVHLGSNDARADQVPSRATHESWYRMFIGNLRTDLSRPDLQFFVMGCQRWTAAASNATDDVYWARARGGEQNVADDANVHFAASCVDLPMYSDDVHLSEAHDGGNAVEARRAAHAVYNAMFGGSQRYTGPQPGSSSYDPATGWITINVTTYGGAELVGKTGQAGLTGFAFFAAGSPVSPVTAPFVSGPAQVAAQLAAGLSSVTYAYQESHAPDVTNPLFDNGPAPVEP
ncbi:MAG: SGNH/GDSL hydrolase family protein [Sphingobium sp.]|nr:SGNH/GDSL hydrolase family protein [Sphingobium sp.]